MTKVHEIFKLTKNPFFVFYVISAVILLLFSYTQVDLSLTLSQAGFIRTLQSGFQYIGFYQRPLATYIYLAIILIITLLYLWILKSAKEHKINILQVLVIILTFSLILIFSYPAFSYDFFNYMFTAKTVLVYGKNPYIVKPLDFSGVEPWLSFLRWTHLPSAYSPVWIAMTLLPYFFGLGYFLLILWNMKILIISFYILSCYSIYNYLKIKDPKNALYGLVFFALNPLVIIEGLVSPHNDMVMMGMVMFAYLLTAKNNKIYGYLVLALSASVKTMTVFLYPAAILINWNRVWSFWLMVIAMIIGFWQKEILPWYGLWVITLASIYPRNNKILPFITVLSLSLILRYAPYLWFGDYGFEMQRMRFMSTVIPVILFILYIIPSLFIAKIFRKNR